MVSTVPYDASEAWRTLGQRLAAYRKATGLTQEALAAHDLIHYGRSTIANVETGRQQIGRDFWLSCDAILEASGELVREYDRINQAIRVRRLAGRPSAGPGSQATTGNPMALAKLPGSGLVASLSSGALDPRADEEDDRTMIRRKVLLALAAAGGAAISDRAQTFVASGDPYADMVADVDHWQETAWEYGFSYITASRERLLVDICADQASVRRQLADSLTKQDMATARPLAAVAAQLTSLLALICTDIGYSREACHLWRFARRYADLSEDDAVRLWVSGHEVVSGIYQQRPLPVLADLAYRANAIGHAAAPSAGKAELLGGYSQVLSLMGRGREAQGLLEVLHDTYEGLPTALTSLQQSFFGWPEHRLHHIASFTNSMAGSIVRASISQDAALRLYPQEFWIGPCQINLHRARCLIRDGELREGLQHATQALSSINVPRRAEFVLVIAETVAEAVPPPQRHRSEYREFRELVRLSRTDAGR